MSLLSQNEIKEKIKDFSGWQLDDKHLHKEFIFSTFTDAMIFVNEIAQVAEDMSHYPDVVIHRNTVKLSTTTPDFGDVSEKDIELVQRAQEAERSVFGELSR